jgi:hypothetical protein
VSAIRARLAPLFSPSSLFGYSLFAESPL